MSTSDPTTMTDQELAERDVRVARLCRLIALNHDAVAAHQGRGPLDFAAELTVDGLRRHRQELEAELAALLRERPASTAEEELAALRATLEGKVVLDAAHARDALLALERVQAESPAEPEPFDEDAEPLACGHPGRMWSSEWRACMACSQLGSVRPAPEALRERVRTIVAEYAVAYRQWSDDGGWGAPCPSLYDATDRILALRRAPVDERERVSDRTSYDLTIRIAEILERRAKEIQAMQLAGRNAMDVRQKAVMIALDILTEMDIARAALQGSESPPSEARERIDVEVLRKEIASLFPPPKESGDYRAGYDTAIGDALRAFGRAVLRPAPVRESEEGE